MIVFGHNALKVVIKVKRGQRVAPLMVVLLSYKKREGDTTSTHGAKAVCQYSKSVFKPRGEVVSEINITSTSILYFQLPELWENTFLLCKSVCGICVHCFLSPGMDNMYIFMVNMYAIHKFLINIIKKF